MRTVAAILMLVLAVAWPMGVLVWLAARLNRSPRPSPRWIGCLLALTLLLPTGLVLTGFGLLLPVLQNSRVFWGVVVAAWLGVLVSAAGLAWTARTSTVSQEPER
jgi:hypothetical protein